MGRAVLTLSIIPKRMLSKSEAAEHCGRPIKRFEVECPVRAIVFANGDCRYDVHDLDNWIDSIKGGMNDAVDVVDRLE
jgi:hypothetical protein